MAGCVPATLATANLLVLTCCHDPQHKHCHTHTPIHLQSQRCARTYTCTDTQAHIQTLCHADTHCYVWLWLLRRPLAAWDPHHLTTPLPLPPPVRWVAVTANNDVWHDSKRWRPPGPPLVGETVQCSHDKFIADSTPGDRFLESTLELPHHRVRERERSEKSVLQRVADREVACVCAGSRPAGCCLHPPHATVLLCNTCVASQCTILDEENCHWILRTWSCNSFFYFCAVSCSPEWTDFNISSFCSALPTNFFDFLWFLRKEVYCLHDSQYAVYNVYNAVFS